MKIKIKQKISTELGWDRLEFISKWLEMIKQWSLALNGVKLLQDQQNFITFSVCA